MAHFKVYGIGDGKTLLECEAPGPLYAVAKMLREVKGVEARVYKCKTGPRIVCDKLVDTGAFGAVEVQRPRYTSTTNQGDRR